MMRSTCPCRALLIVLALASLATTAATAAETRPRSSAKRTAKPAVAPDPLAEPRLEPKAIDVLKTASATLAAARTMRFTAIVSYESPSLLGPPLVYTTESDVVLQRPDKLRVLTIADGPPSEFYYDGKTMTAFAPTENLVAVADAPPTIDATLKAAFDSAAIYFPFSDLIVADPYRDLADGLKLAFYVGQSQVVGDTTTDIVAYANSGVFVQAWIGSEDHLPRRLRAVYRADPSRLRHQVDLSQWWLNLDIPPGVFGSPKAAAATRVEFARPDPPASAPAAPRQRQPAQAK